MAALVLAIEPDPSQATVLRQIIGTRTKADVTVVESRDAAIDALDEAVPDLILLTALLSPGDEEALIRHLRTLPQAADVQTLTIPRLREADGKTSARFFSRKRRKTSGAGCDPAVFAQEVDQYLRRAHELRREALDRPASAADRAPASPVDRDRPPDAVPVAGDAHGGGSDDPWQWRPGEPNTVAPAPADVTPVWVEDGAREPGSTPDTSPQETSPVSVLATAQDEDRHSSDGGRSDDQPVRSVASDATTAGSASGAIGPADSSEALERMAAATLAADAKRTEAEAEARLAIELERVRSEADERRRAELDQLRAEADAAREQAVAAAREKAQLQAHESLATELQRVRAEADRTLSTEADKARAAGEHAKAAEAARITSEQELARVRREAEERLSEELGKARDDAMRAQRAEQTLSSEADKARAATEHASKAETARLRAEQELARVRTEAEHTLSAELEKARDAAARARREELDRVKAEADALRDSATREAREAAQRTAAAELASVRDEAERMLSDELERVRVESAQMLEVELRKARIAADEARLSELSHVQEEADALKVSAEHKISEAERSAAEQLEAEVARVRAEAEARITDERAKADREASESTLAELNETRAKGDELREVAVREAQSVAEAAARQALETEITRVRSDADQKLSEQLDKIRAESDQRRAAELADLQAQIGDLRRMAEQTATPTPAPMAPSSMSPGTPAGTHRPPPAGPDVSASTPATRLLVATRWLSDAARGLLSTRPGRRRAWAASGEEARRTDAVATSPSRTAPADAPAAPALTAPADASAAPVVRATSQGPRRRTVAVFETTRTKRQQGGLSTSPSIRPAASETIQTIADEVATERRPSATERSDYYSLWRVETPPSPTPGKAAPQPPPARSRVRRWLVTAAASLLVMLIDGLDMGGVVTEPLVSAPPAGAPAAPPPTRVPAAAEVKTVTPVGRLEVHSIPARARVAVDGETRGSTPLVLDDVAPGRHEVVVSSSAGTVRRTATVRENRTVTIYETISPGWIAVFSRIKLDIAIDGRQVGTTEDGHLLVAPGRHDVVLANRRLGFRERHTFDVEPGEVTAHTVVLPSTSVRFIGVAGTEILVDGEPIGVLPLDSVELPIGTRELVKRFPDGTDARERIELGIGAPTTIAVDARPASPASDRRGALTVFPPGHR